MNGQYVVIAYNTPDGDRSSYVAAVSERDAMNTAAAALGVKRLRNVRFEQDPERVPMLFADAPKGIVFRAHRLA
jgi:hypothetical protein